MLRLDLEALWCLCFGLSERGRSGPCSVGLAPAKVVSATRFVRANLQAPLAGPAGRLAAVIQSAGVVGWLAVIASDVTVTREASLAAGNCREGPGWAASWFPGRHSVSAHEAAEAIARGKPRLARYMARTAHLVHRRRCEARPRLWFSPASLCRVRKCPRYEGG